MSIYPSADTRGNSSNAESTEKIDLPIPLELDSKIRSVSEALGTSVEEVARRALLHGLTVLEDSNLTGES